MFQSNVLTLVATRPHFCYREQGRSNVKKKRSRMHEPIDIEKGVRLAYDTFQFILDGTGHGMQCQSGEVIFRGNIFFVLFEYFFLVFIISYKFVKDVVSARPESTTRDGFRNEPKTTTSVPYSFSVFVMHVNSTRKGEACLPLWTEIACPGQVFPALFAILTK